MAYFEIYYHDRICVSAFNDAPPPSNNDFRTKSLMRFNIDGFFTTTAGREYLKDIALSMTSNLNSQLMKIVYHSYHEQNGTSYKLCDFDDIKRKVKVTSHAALNVRNKDVIFEILRTHAQKLISKGVEDIEKELNDYGCLFTNDWKKVKSKAKSIVRYFDGGGAFGRVKLTDMSREQNAKHQSLQRSKKKMQEFTKYIKLFKDDSISSIARGLKLDRKTVRKYLLEINMIKKYSSFFTAKLGEETNALRGMLYELHERQSKIRESSSVKYVAQKVDKIIEDIKSLIQVIDYKPIDN